ISPSVPEQEESNEERSRDGNYDDDDTKDQKYYYGNKPPVHNTQVDTDSPSSQRRTRNNSSTMFQSPQTRGHPGKTGLHDIYSSNSAQPHTDVLTLKDYSVSQPRASKCVRFKPVLEEHETTKNDKWKELLELKKTVKTMELKMDGLQFHMKSLETATAAQLKHLAQEKVVPDISILKAERNSSNTIHEIKKTKIEMGTDPTEADMKVLKHKNDSLGKKLRQLSTRMTILSQRNTDSMVLLRDLQQIVVKVLESGSTIMSSNEEK
ncbi:hypothetical protein RFI_08206, partial [Reticulomyxa filosa]